MKLLEKINNKNMSKDKLNNLLNFKEYDKLGCTKKITKRTDVGGDILMEHHKNTPDGKKSYIKQNLNGISDKLIDKIYNLIESEIEIKNRFKVYKDEEEDEEENY